MSPRLSTATRAAWKMEASCTNKPEVMNVIHVLILFASVTYNSMAWKKRKRRPQGLSESYTYHMPPVLCAWATRGSPFVVPSSKCRLFCRWPRGKKGTSLKTLTGRGCFPDMFLVPADEIRIPEDSSSPSRFRCTSVRMLFCGLYSRTARKITHPLGVIPEPGFSKTRGLHCTQRIRRLWGDMPRSFHRRVRRSAFLPSAL